MTKFEQLRILAIEKSRSFSEYRNEIEHFANDLVAGLRKHLGSAGKTIRCREVDRDHNVIGEQVPYVEACFCEDLLWYFKLVFNFSESPEPVPEPLVDYRAEILVGLRKSGPDFLVTLPGKELRVTSEREMENIYDYLFRSMSGELERPWTEPQEKQFGFVVPKFNRDSRGRE